jgi:HK97 family phage portal protein
MPWFRRKEEERVLALNAFPGIQPVLGGDAIAPTRALQVADVFACVRVLADSAASVPLIPYRRLESGRARVTGGNLARLLDRPAPATTQANLVGQMVAHLTLHGNAFLGKFRAADGRIDQLAMLHPERVEVELVRGEPRYTVWSPEGARSVHGVEDVIHVRALSTDGLLGLSPIRQCKLAVSLADGLGAFSEAFVRNGARPSGIIKVPSGSNRDAVMSIAEQAEARHGGARNAHRIAVVTGDIEWQALAGSVEDMQFVEQRKLSTAEICRIFRVPPWMVGASSGDSMTYSNTEQQMLAFAMHSLRPWLVVVEQAISADQDLCPGSLYVEFLLDALLRADSKTRAEIYQMALDPVTGWLNRNEVRRLENLDPEPLAAQPQPQLMKELIANGSNGA